MGDDEPDDELILRMAAGDDSALRVLFSRHAPPLARRLRALLPAADVEDVLQETFVAAWRGAGRYRPEGVARGWLWGIARRQAALLLRQRGPTALTVPGVVRSTDRDKAPNPADAATSRVDLETALDALGPPGSPERELWRLLYVEERSVAEIAELTNVPEGTVKSRAYRVRRLLRGLLSHHMAMEGGS